MPTTTPQPDQGYCWGCKRPGHEPGGLGCTTLTVNVTGESTTRIHLTHLIFSQGNFETRCGDCGEHFAGPERLFGDAACRHAVRCSGLKPVPKPSEPHRAPTWLIGWAAVVALVLIALWIVSPSR